ncbi:MULTISPECIES: hypothetical protein [Pseudomonas]|jgi:hypothetical protein|uniref:DUF4124 domain-containing protein n=1 Tax=Pseudomonas syringae TaxID=317 RepID=A0A085V3H5_PSESX|nr:MULTISPECIES: hypothetical protein [Pseudomonas]EPJ86282.1 hypothetical protein CFII64_10744 [Pseudomonas sp. CFII64]KFE49988.1 hypothetical protein IV02_18515 [Pseudomonas syringae]
MNSRIGLTLIIATLLVLGPMSAHAQTARYYKWQGADRVVCAQTSPGKGWTRLHGAFIKSDCSI